MGSYRSKIRLFILQGTIILIFILYSMYDHLIPLSQQYCSSVADHGHTCQEDVYTFHCPNDKRSIFTDLSVYDKCLAMEAKIVSKVPDSPQLEIRTKCSRTSLILLSFQQYQEKTWNSKEYIVPNKVHYVLFCESKHFSYLNYLSFYSVHKFLKPDMIILHGDCIPHGHWWLKTLQEVANLYSAHIAKPRLIQGIKPSYVEHASDIARLQILLEEGGIYLDMDILILKSLDELRNYPVTLGKEGDMLLNNGIIVARPKASFICMWLESYRQYKRSFYFGLGWNTYSVQYPYYLSFIYKSLIHIEEERLVRPNMYESGKLLYNGHFDWSKHYTIHVWRRIRGARFPVSEKDLKDNFSNCSIGDIIKYILSSIV